MNYEEICRGPIQKNRERGFLVSGAAAGSNVCPERIAKILMKRGWCHTEYGWSHEKIAPVNVTWKDAVDIQLSSLSPVLFARLDLY
jgi:hypothetical protein